MMVIGDDDGENNEEDGDDVPGPQKIMKDQDDKLLSFQGFKLKMDDMGNILIKRLSKSPVYARNTLEVKICC